MYRKEKCLLALRLILGLMCAMLAGIDLSFNVYAICLKETFNFTQTQVEITASMSALGYGLTFLETLTTATFGYTTSFVVIGFGMPLSSALFSLAARYGDFVHSHPVLVYVAQLFLSTCNGCSVMIVKRVCLEMLGQKYAGTYIGIAGATICFGKIFFAAQFELFFHNDLAGFFLCLATTTAVVTTSCYAILYPVAMATEKPTAKETIEPDDKDKTEMFKSRYFHTLFWSSAFLASVGYTILNNITSITDSLGMHDAFLIVTTMSLCIMGSRIVCGILYDKASSQTCGFAILFKDYFSLGMGMIIGLFFLNTTSVYLLAALSGIGYGSSYTIPLAMLVVHFGVSNYSALSGAFYFVEAVIILTMQVFTGYFYDNMAPANHTVWNVCQGGDCFYWSFLGLFVLNVAVCCVQVINMIVMGHKSADPS